MTGAGDRVVLLVTVLLPSVSLICVYSYYILYIVTGQPILQSKKEWPSRTSYNTRSKEAYKGTLCISTVNASRLQTGWP